MPLGSLFNFNLPLKKVEIERERNMEKQQMLHSMAITEVYFAGSRSYLLRKISGSRVKGRCRDLEKSIYLIKCGCLNSKS